MAIMQEIETKLQKGISVSSNEEVYFALLDLVKEKAEGKVSNKGKKKLYYISAEFLIGKLLSNNLINLGIYDEVKETLAKNGKSLAEIEEVELEPSLGNGGLGRLAACFIDSIATLGLNGDGVGLNYQQSSERDSKPMDHRKELAYKDRYHISGKLWWIYSTVKTL